MAIECLSCGTRWPHQEPLDRTVTVVCDLCRKHAADFGFSCLSCERVVCPSEAAAADFSDRICPGAAKG